MEIWPSRGTNATLMAFNPNTGLVYLNSWEIARILKFVKFDFVLGQGSTGVETSFTAPAGEPWGYHMAFDPLSGKAKWKVPLIEFGELRRDASDRRRAFVHGSAQRRVHRARSGHRPKAVEVQDRVGNQFASDHIHLPGTSIRYRAFRIGGAVNRRLKGYDLIPAGGSVTTFALMPE